ncbi:ATPase associated with various cellular activities AAA_5 [Gloeothece citriformis PCC 7424]|uniref:ATPase associated with various cellular activities AAA_5 n=1 Tax=Gloeothece citriformis (strain PCC 7424) TaxID=65393 RepID=B7KK37_GLOC7|nr:MoxR family ATPase [Gloeothece citriformis]ACK70922.1 ATPase associated with various cellular activities AAA_5 [Gloeothece citriformis PCC 7424]
MEKNLKYTGKIKPKAGEIDDKTGDILYPYFADDDLIKAVNYAIFLNRPLLLEGEPGGGKTQLARAVAYELKLDYKAYSVKSTSKAIDLLYTFDTIGRLRDAQLAATGQISEKDLETIKKIETYRKYGVLGNAFTCGKPMVILIDEIDKADVDFPNDLLDVLDDTKKFYIPETKEDVLVSDGSNPIIFITSNSQKKLSDAFLRRCLYYSVKCPQAERLKEIVRARFPQYKKVLKPDLLEKAVSKFIDLKEQMEDDIDERTSTKIISTSEWIDWVHLMCHNPQEFEKSLDNDQIPCPEALLKSSEDRQRYLEENDDE